MEKPEGVITEMDLSIARYEQLAQQSEMLRHRLDLAFPGWSDNMPLLDSESSQSGHSSPVRRRSSMGTVDSIRPVQTHNGSQTLRRQKSISSPLTLVASLPDAVDTGDEEALHDIFQLMKTELTQLLNCDTVKQDKSLRYWVQGKLMDTELELRQFRRRRSSHHIDEKTLQAFADHLAQSEPSVGSLSRDSSASNEE